MAALRYGAYAFGAVITATKRTGTTHRARSFHLCFGMGETRSDRTALAVFSRHKNLWQQYKAYQLGFVPSQSAFALLDTAHFGPASRPPAKAQDPKDHLANQLHGPGDNRGVLQLPLQSLAVADVLISLYARFINEQFPGRIAEAYAKLQIGAAQADLWRLLVLYRFGGVYLDIDAHVAWPLGLAIDPDLDELYVLHRGGKLSNYFIASVQENPNLALVIDAVLKNIDRPTTTNIFELTGPAVLHDALGDASVPTAPYAMTCYQGSFTNEFFQYVDHPQGKWVRIQGEVRPIKS